MDRTMTFWLITLCFFLLWYGFGAFLMMVSVPSRRAALRSFFLGGSQPEGLPWWGRSLMAGIFGMTSAAIVMMAGPGLCAMLC